MAYFNDQNIFGVAVKMATADNPRSAQVNAYPGLNGLEELDHGLRGRFTTVSGKLIGSNPGDLDGAEALVRSYNDGNVYLLVDNLGRTWANVKLDVFEPSGKIVVMNSPDGGVIYVQDYTCRFKHL